MVTPLVPDIFVAGISDGETFADFGVGPPAAPPGTPGSRPQPPPLPPGAAPFAQWEESQHPRGQPENRGEFGPGGGGAEPASAAQTPGPTTPPQDDSPWGRRQAGREARRAAAEQAPAGAWDTSRIESTRKDLEEDPSAEKARGHVLLYAELWRGQEAELQKAGATEAELARVAKARLSGESATARRLGVFVAAHAKHAEAAAALARAEQGEPPEPGPADYPPEPEEPQEPEGGDQAAQKGWEREHDKWEKDHDRWESAYSKVDEDYSRAHDRWESQAGKAQEKADSAEEKAGDALSALTDALDEHDEKFQGVVDKVADAATVRVDAEEEADPEPEEPEAPFAEWDESKHPRGQPENVGEFGPGGGAAPRPVAAPTPPDATAPPPAPQADPGARPKAPSAPWRSDADIAAHGARMAAAHEADPHVRALRDKYEAVRDRAVRPAVDAPDAASALAALEDLHAGRAEAERLREGLAHEARRSLLLSFGLGLGRRARIDAWNERSGTTQTENWRKAALFLEEMVAKDGAGDQRVSLKATRGRAHYDVGTIHTAKTDDVGITVHEFGHHLERLHSDAPWVRARVSAFRAKRFDDAEGVNMRDVVPHAGYGADEVGNKDDMAKVFRDDNMAYYSGKTYPGGETEIVSMGMEQLYRDPVHFAAADPEYFSLIVGILQRGGGQ